MTAARQILFWFGTFLFMVVVSCVLAIVSANLVIALGGAVLSVAILRLIPGYRRTWSRARMPLKAGSG